MTLASATMLAAVAGQAALAPLPPGAASPASAPSVPASAAPPAVSASAGAAAAAPPGKFPFSLTVRGGVSLGSYEAGLNWAFLRLLRRGRFQGRELQLESVTGASAGNINTFLTAATWCQSNAIEGGEHVERNLFWDAWVPIGWEALFPKGGGPDAFRPDDGLFTRNAFQDIERRLVESMGRSQHRACTLPLGVTVTRARPQVIHIQGKSNDGNDRIEVATQRFVATFRAESKGGGRLRFSQPNDRDHQVGEYIRLPTERDGAIDPQRLIGLMEASSAFPVAFGPRAIEYCLEAAPGGPDAGPGQPGAQACQGGLRTDRFFDGGVFDNVPLGLAVSLLRTNHARGQGPPPEATEIVYLDPGHRRDYDARGALTIARLPDLPPDSQQLGLRNVFDFLGNFALVSQDYELQTASRYLFHSWEIGGGSAPVAVAARAQPGAEERPVARPPRISSRLHGIAGEFLGHFAAFLVRAFREYDYRIGVYDALFNFSLEMCSEQMAAMPAGPRREAALRSCMLRGFRQRHDALGLAQPEAVVTSYLVRRLLSDELPRWASGGGRAEACTALGERWQPDQGAGADAGAGRCVGWSTDPPVLPAAETPARAAAERGIALMNGLLEATAQSERYRHQLERAPPGPEKQRLLALAGFNEFVALFWNHPDVVKVHADAAAFSPMERALLSDPDGWFRRESLDVVERLDQIEDRDRWTPGKDAISFAQLVLHTEPLRLTEWWDLDPSSIPDRRHTVPRVLFHFLPYEFSGEVMNGGGRLAWRPTVVLGRVANLVLRPTLDFHRGERVFFQSLGAGLLLRVPKAVLTGIELVPAVVTTRLHDGRPIGDATWGAELGLYVLAGKLRLGFGTSDWRGGADALTLRIGLSDLNGVLYWGARFVRN